MAKKKGTKKWTQAQDDAYDKKNKVSAKRDAALDKKRKVK